MYDEYVIYLENTTAKLPCRLITTKKIVRLQLVYIRTIYESCPQVLY